MPFTPSTAVSLAAADGAGRGAPFNTTLLGRRSDTLRHGATRCDTTEMSMRQKIRQKA